MTSSMGNPDGAPLMADIMSGPTAPLTKAFLFCGWRCLPVDWLIDPTHDLAHPARQASLSEQLQSVDSGKPMAESSLGFAPGEIYGGLRLMARQALFRMLHDGGKEQKSVFASQH